MNSEPLPTALVKAYRASGEGSEAVMPAGRTTDVQEALTRAVVDLGFRDEFVRDLETAFRFFEVDPTLPRLAEVSTPDEQFLTRGFNGMSDLQLAAIAIDPRMIEAVAGVVLEDANSDFAPARPGEWLRDARKRWGKTPQWLAERLNGKPTEQTVEVADTLRDLEKGQHPDGFRSSATTPSELHRNWLASNWSGLLVGGGLAAALLVGLYTLRPTPTDPNRPSGERYESYAMVVQPKVSQLRGDKEVKLSVTWERDGYVGLLVHVPGKGLLVRPDSDEQPDRVEKDKATPERTLPTGANWVIVVCCEQDPSPVLREWVKANKTKAVTPGAGLVRELQSLVKEKKLGMSQVQYQAFP